MRAIIMAAGVGSRLRGITGDRPKCLIRAGEQTLLGRVIEQLRDRGVHDVCVITGYKSALVERALLPEVLRIHNPFYRVTNSIASLWLARELLTEDTLLLNADLFLEPVVVISRDTYIYTRQRSIKGQPLLGNRNVDDCKIIQRRIVIRKQADKHCSKRFAGGNYLKPVIDPQAEQGRRSAR